MSFQVSPGISISEVDLTAGAQQVSVSDAAFAGPFLWGPGLDAKNVGSEDELVRMFGKPDNDIASYWFSAQSFLAYSNLLHVVRALPTDALNATAGAKPFTGIWKIVGTNTTIVANVTGNCYGMFVGQRIKVAAEERTVASIVSNAEFTTTVACSANGEAVVAGYGLLVRNDNHYDVTFSNGYSGFSCFVAKYPGTLGNSLKVSICPSVNAFADAAITGTLDVTSGNAVVNGTSTAFGTDVIVGDILTFDGHDYQVASIANTTRLTLSTAVLVTNASITTTNWTREWEFAYLFDGAPGTSEYVSTRGGSKDEMHAVVVDTTGAFTGTPNTVLERYEFVSKASDAKSNDGEGNYYVDVINRKSSYVRWLAHGGSVTTNWGGASTLTFSQDEVPTTVTLVGGMANNASITDSAIETAYDLFTNADDIDISMVITGPASAAVSSYIIQNICETRMDCVAFVSPNSHCVVNNTDSEVADITTFRNSLPSSSYAFMDSGWKYAYDKYNDKYRWVPLNGDMAGIAARTDSSNDPWYSPAGYTRGNVKNIVKLSWNPGQSSRDSLYKIGVNPVVSFPAQGVVLYGDRTLLTRPSAFDRINVRRLFIILEKTIAKMARAQLFEFNDEYTRSQFRNIVEPYLRDVKSRRGVTDYRVICDESNNTTEVIEQNRFVGDIYVKPARAINFIQLSFVAVRSGVSFQEVTGAL